MKIRKITEHKSLNVVERYQPVDLILKSNAEGKKANPFNLKFSATFQGPNGQALTVPGFFDSDMGFVVRFAPNVIGAWSYVSRSNSPQLDGIAGGLSCIKSENPNVHGPLRVDTGYPQHFVYEDGEHCFLMGYEVNWLMMIDQLPSDLTRIELFLDDIYSAGFNMVSINTYAYIAEWIEEFDNAAGEAEYVVPKIPPWPGSFTAPDYSRFESRFFRHFDRIMMALFSRGTLAHLMIHVYNKRVDWPELGSEADERYWRYIISRYQAFCNVIFDPSKECFRQDFNYIVERLGRIRQIDAYRRIITAHDPNPPLPEEKNYREEKDLIDDLCDFKCDQIHKDWYDNAYLNYHSNQRPYVNIEYGYENGVKGISKGGDFNRGDWREILRRTWLITMGGGYINYYYADTAWTVFVPRPIPPGYAAHSHYRNFWLRTHFWLLSPNNAPLGKNRKDDVYCRCATGREYVILDEKGVGFELFIPGDHNTYRIVWFDPLTGKYAGQGFTFSGKRHFISPWGKGQWAVMHVWAD